jgi:hypothetical protein
MVRHSPPSKNPLSHIDGQHPKPVPVQR